MGVIRPKTSKEAVMPRTTEMSAMTGQKDK